MVSGVVAVVFGSYITLEKGFTFTTTWSDARNCMVRVLDAIEIDLRNATSITITPGTPAQTLSLKIPDRYATYYTGSNLIDNPADPRYHLVLSGSNVRAGESGTSIISGTINPNNGDLTTSGTLYVVYSVIPYGYPTSTGKQLIRSGSWSGMSASGTMVSGSFFRSVATFMNGVNLSYVVLTSSTDGSVSPTVGTSTTTNVTSAMTLGGTNKSVCILLSATTNDLHRPVATGTMQDTVYLRARVLQ